MKSAPIPENEEARLKSLSEHQLLDTLPEEVYDDITRIASEICGTPIALLSLVDEKRQWFKAKQGLSAAETLREYSFCAHAIINPDEPFIVPDARYDERFHDNPLTTGEPHVVFYAGVPVKDTAGHALGTLCVIDNRPRELSDDKIESLKALAKLINTHFELRKKKLRLTEGQQKLQMAKLTANTIWRKVQTLTNNSQPDQPNHYHKLLQAANTLKELT
ncbi:hypothetical protein AAE02nite_36610 [Adhaeribacter aerolatus]|uniref:GAF domain-containing protein n=1 Tax=Adhaeribacter aerolatus TaxID=670289 RepID=A0A512B2J4_9BACT|nr:GAF domain-containing protein [Adhaeribacter aerolatus]GEO05997.1 hypothetical protein AAE02nite_36610 [Adhaeribacter aerolatus]